VTPALSQDFDALAVDERFSTRGRTVTEADVAGFAALTGDTHPQHTDAVWAAESPFGARIAHGLLVVSYTLGLLDFDPDRVVALRRIRQATFKRPVMIGDTIHAHCRIDSLTPVDAATGLVGIQADVVNQHGRVAVRLGLDAVWRRGDAVHAVRSTDDGAFALVGIPL
jgi:3-hydroxybutyryl-CoA dehydratase